MRTLWALLLLGVWAQASHGCLVISTEAIERQMSAHFAQYFGSVKGSPLPDMHCSAGKAKKLNVKDVDGKVTAKYNRDGTISINHEGLYTVSSEGSDELTFNANNNFHITPDTDNEFFSFGIDPDSYENTVTKVHGEADNETEEHCIVSLKAMSTGAVDGAVVALNTDNAELTEEFTHNGLTCHYGISNYAMLEEEALSVYIGAYCNDVGLINNPEGVTVTPPGAGEDANLYVDQALIASALAAAPVAYTVQLSEAEKHSAFEPGTGGVSLSFTSSTPPEVSLSDSESTAKYYLKGSFNDESGQSFFSFDIDVQADIDVMVQNSRATARFSNGKSDQVNFNPECPDCEPFIAPLVAEHAKQAIEELSCKIDPMPAPKQNFVEIPNASCSPQTNQIKCVPKKWRA